MSSVVCQGLQSCLEPREVEPLVLRHKLTPPKSQAVPWLQENNLEENSHEEDNIDHHDDDNNNKVNKNGELGGWSFLDALENPTQTCEQVSEKEYVHPMVKRSASALSSKSLEMCTESLGCETGSDISESSDEFCSISWEKERLLAMQRSRARQLISKKAVTTRSIFPPPLTSISGSDGVRVRPHREDGRLVIKAVNVSSCRPYFQAERTNGRLKLSLLKRYSINCHNGMPETEMNEAANYYEEEEEDDDNDNVNNNDDDDYAEELYDDDDEEEEYWVGDMDGKARGGIGIGEFPRPGSCKEGRRNGNKGISKWESFWIAIS